MSLFGPTQPRGDVRETVTSFPVAPRFLEDEAGNPVAYEDGTPTLTSIANAILASDPETEKFLDVIVVGHLATPRVDVKKKKKGRK